MVTLTELREAAYSNNHIHCSCGEKFYVPLASYLTDLILDDPFEDLLYSEDIYICPNCGLKYELSLRGERHINIYLNELRIKEKTGIGLDEKQINLNVLEGKAVGDLLENFPDDRYIHNGKEYIVQDEKIINIWSLPDENQMLLF